MPDPTYPVLSVAPSVTGWKEKAAYDPAIRTPYEAGYVQTRPRHTRIPLMWELQYVEGNALPEADKATLQAFEHGVGIGSAMFQWTHPRTGTVYAVRFKEPVEYMPQGNHLYWRVRLVLEQV